MYKTEFSDSSDVTVVLTSCGRFDLLTKTIDSFLQQNSYPIKGFIITEDSGDEAVRECAPEALRDKFTFIVNNPKLGQVKSIDKAYGLVETPYIFHCEDDWEFYRSGFVEDSKALLEVDSNILQVWLRSFYHDIRIHSGYHYWGDRAEHDGIGYYRVMSRKPDWAGFSFNPGLRRLSDYQMIGKYDDYDHEKSLSVLYRDKGMWAAALESDAVAHLGFGEHVEDVRENKKRIRKKRRKILVNTIVLGLMILLVLMEVNRGEF
jgi:hypothetical protein